MLNHICLHGRLTKDPELRRTQAGVAVTSFSIACDQDFTDKDGKRPTDFIDCTAWRQTAEFIAKYFQKGSEIIVSGRLQNEKWTDSQGNKRISNKVVVDRADFCGKKDGGARADEGIGPYGGKDNGTQYAAYDPLAEDDPDCPF